MATRRPDGARQTHAHLSRRLSPLSDEEGRRWGGGHWKRKKRRWSLTTVEHRRLLRPIEWSNVVKKGFLSISTFGEGSRKRKGERERSSSAMYDLLCSPSPRNTHPSPYDASSPTLPRPLPSFPCSSGSGERRRAFPLLSSTQGGGGIGELFREKHSASPSTSVRPRYSLLDSHTSTTLKTPRRILFSPFPSAQPSHRPLSSFPLRCRRRRSRRPCRRRRRRLPLDNHTATALPPPSLPPSRRCIIIIIIIIDAPPEAKRSEWRASI